MADDEHDKKGKKSSGVRRVILPALALLILLPAVLYLILNSPGALNLIAKLTESQTGVSLTLKDVDFSGDFTARMEKLSLSTKQGLSAELDGMSTDAALMGLLAGEIKELTLRNPKFRYELKPSEKGPQNDENEKPLQQTLRSLPSIRKLRIINGEAHIALKGVVLNIKNLDLTLTGFSPQVGGLLSLKSDYTIAKSTVPSVDAAGFISTEVQLGPLTLSNPSLSGTLSAEIQSAITNAVTLAGGKLSSTFSVKNSELRVSPVTFTADSAASTETGFPFAPDGVTLIAEAAYNLKNREISALVSKASVGGVGSAEVLLKGGLSTGSSIDVELNAPSINLEALFLRLRPFIPENQHGWYVGGTGGASFKGRALMADGGPGLKGSLKLTLKEGAFSSPEGDKAAEGLGANITLMINTAGMFKKASVEANAAISGGEVLYGTFYKSLQAGDIGLKGSGDFFFDKGLTGKFKGSGNFFHTGAISLTVDKNENTLSLSAASTDFSITRFHQNLLKPFLVDSNSALKEMALEGAAAFDIGALKSADKGPVRIKGKLSLNDTFFKAGPEGLVVSGISVHQPFTLFWPDEDFKSAPKTTSVPEGDITIGEISIKGISSGPVRLRPVIAENSLEVTTPVEIPLSGGTVTVKDIEAVHILNPLLSRASLSIHTRGVDTAPITKKLFFREIPGSLDVDLPLVTLEPGSGWRTSGTTRLSVFGGSVEVTGLRLEEIHKPSRKVSLDVLIREIDLGLLTRIVPVGRVTGIIEGSLNNFVFHYGQPERFDFELVSVKTRGVKQSISVEAIENISILSTGSAAMTSILKTGVNRFFNNYPYSAIGVYSTLKNDKFLIGGKLKGQDGREYLVKRGFLRGIDIVNHNPGKRVSFKDMYERVKRVMRKSPGESVIIK